jgi:hypothetical protein
MIPNPATAGPLTRSLGLLRPPAEKPAVQPSRLSNPWTARNPAGACRSRTGSGIDRRAFFLLSLFAGQSGRRSCLNRLSRLPCQSLDRKTDLGAQTFSSGTPMRDNVRPHARVPEFFQMSDSAGYRLARPLAREECANLIGHSDKLVSWHWRGAFQRCGRDG